MNASFVRAPKPTLGACSSHFCLLSISRRVAFSAAPTRSRTTHVCSRARNSDIRHLRKQPSWCSTMTAVSERSIGTTESGARRHSTDTSRSIASPSCTRIRTEIRNRRAAITPKPSESNFRSWSSHHRRSLSRGPMGRCRTLPRTPAGTLRYGRRGGDSWNCRAPTGIAGAR